MKVYVIVRHTRAGDRREGVEEDRGRAMRIARQLCEEAANLYGYANISVYPAILRITGRALKPRRAEQ